MRILSLSTAARDTVRACLAARAADGTQFCGPNHGGAGAERIAVDRPANGC